MRRQALHASKLLYRRKQKRRKRLYPLILRKGLVFNCASHQKCLTRNRKAGKMASCCGAQSLSSIK
jgi:hypothetical protein